jgi:DNA-binding CsgD family transcriptional regulator
MEWSYVAGYFDGEGHVSVDHARRRQRMNALIWSNCHEASLVAMRDFMGVGTVRQDKDVAGIRKRPIYRLTISNRSDLLSAIGGMLPHLIVKYDQVVTLRDHVTIYVDAIRSQNHGRVSSVDTEVLREWYQNDQLSCSEIAQRLGVTVSAVAMSLRVRGIPRRGRGWGKGISKSPETRRKISESKKGRPSKLRGTSRSAETRRKISEAHRRRVESRREQSDP